MSKVDHHTQMLGMSLGTSAYALEGRNSLFLRFCINMEEIVAGIYLQRLCKVVPAPGSALATLPLTSGTAQVRTNEFIIYKAMCDS